MANDSSNTTTTGRRAEGRSITSLAPAIRSIRGGDGLRQPGYQVSVLKTNMSASVVRVYNGLPFASADAQKNIKKTLDIFEEHFVEQNNEIYERYVFLSRQHEQSESKVECVTPLRRLSIPTCNVESVTLEQLLRDRIVYGIRSQALRPQLLRQNM